MPKFVTVLEGTEVYDIHVHSNPLSSVVEIEVHGLSSLPSALKRLAEIGYDMAPSLEVLQKAVEEQRKRKTLEAAINDLAAPKRSHEDIQSPEEWH